MNVFYKIKNVDKIKNVKNVKKRDRDKNVTKVFLHLCRKSLYNRNYSYSALDQRRSNLGSAEPGSTLTVDLNFVKAY